MKSSIYFLILFLVTIAARAQTSLEKKSIQPAKIISVGLEDSDNSPLEFLLDKENSGFHVELVNQVAKTIGYNVQWRRLPWARALISLEKGDLDAVTYLSPSPERNKYILFLADNFLSYGEICLFAKKDQASKIHFSGDLHELTKYQFGYMKDYLYSKEIIQAKAYLKYEEFPGSSRHQVEQLLGSRFDITFMSPARFTDLKKNDPLRAEQIKMLKPCLRSDDAYIGFSKLKAADVAEKFAAAMRKFKHTHDYAKLLKTYNLQYLTDSSK